METGQTSIYDSLRAAAKEFNKSHKSLSYSLDNGKLYRGRYLITKI
jgi:hypothetical protein